MKFRKKFTSSFIIASKKRFINRRTISSVVKNTTKLPLLLIDLDYFSHILKDYISHHNSKLKHLEGNNLVNLFAGAKVSNNIKLLKDLLKLKIKILGIFESLLKTILPEKICLFTTKSSVYSDYILYILEPLNIPKLECFGKNTHSCIYNFLLSTSDTSPVFVFTNDISTWMISDLENKHNISFTILSKNDVCVSFNNSTCGELLCKMLNSTKPNHRLGFDVLKNISFQYLFFLLLGLKFFYAVTSSDKEFYLDSKYFRQVKKIAPHEKFLRASGKGLEYLHKIHKTFYFILKHNSFMPIFLYATKEDLDNYLNFNDIIDYQDKYLLLKLKEFYDKTEPLYRETLNIPELKIKSIQLSNVDYWYKNSVTLSCFCHKETELFYSLSKSNLFNAKLFYANLKKLVTTYKKFPSKYRYFLSNYQTRKYLYLYKKTRLLLHTPLVERATKQEFVLSDIPLSDDAESYVDSLITSYLG